MTNNIVDLEMNNGITVKVDRGQTKGVSKYELQEHIEDMFKIKKSYRLQEIIKLSDMCDCMWNLIFCGCNKQNKEILFKLC